MWLSYAAGAAAAAGNDVFLIDAPAGARWPTPRILDEVRRGGYELAVLSTSTPSIANDAAFAQLLKEQVEALRVVLAGPHVSALPTETLAAYEWIDGVFVGEYERTAVELAAALSGGGAPEAVPGVVWRCRDGDVVRGPIRELQDPESLPFVSETYARFLDINDYFYSHSLYPIVTILSARGCPNHCIYCVYPQTFSGRRYRPRSVSSVLEELRFIKKTWPRVREVMFEDDTFSIDHDRTVKLCEAMASADLNLPWSANARCDLDYETLKLMKRAGCRLLCVGIESGDDAVLGSIRKNMELERIERFFADAKRAGVLLHGCFMVGNPGETAATMEHTLSFAKRLLPDTAQFFPVMAYPGTGLYRWAEQNGYLRYSSFDQWLTPDGLHNCVIERPDLPAAALVAFCDRARREFYLSPRYLARKAAQVLTHPAEFLRTARSARRFVKHLIRGTRRTS